MDSRPLPLQPSRLAPIMQPLHAFLSSESSGGIILLASALIAIVWTNSPWGDAYTHFWHTNLSISFGTRVHEMSLAHWVNDGLMVIFFLLVGLEIKRELLIGELATIRRATLPFVAAMGGMIVPAAIYALFNFRGGGAHGWGVPMATDIAFAVGVLALFGRNVPTAIKVFLLAIAIVDDLGAVLVIAFFYTSHLSMFALSIAAAFLLALVALNVLRVHSPLPYVLLGIGLWIATLCSGLHATIAGVLLAFTIPATRQLEESRYVEVMRDLLTCFKHDADEQPDQITDDQSHAIKAMEEASQAVQTPLARVEHDLLKPVAFVIVPLFALANAGVDLRHGAGGAGGAADSVTSVFTSPTMWGVALGLFVGKTVGVLLAVWIALKCRIATLPSNVTVRHLVGVAVLCGIGFTMSLFVANLAFAADDPHFPAAKVGILAGSLVSGLTGAIIIAGAGKK